MGLAVNRSEQQAELGLVQAEEPPPCAHKFPPPPRQAAVPPRVSRKSSGPQRGSRARPPSTRSQCPARSPPPHSPFSLPHGAHATQQAPVLAPGARPSGWRR